MRITWTQILTLASVAAVLTMSAAPAQATAITMYSDRALWTAAAPGNTTIDFEGVATFNNAAVFLDNSNRTIGNATFTGNQVGFFVDSTLVADGAYHTSDYLEWEGGAKQLTVTFASPVTAFGVDIGTFYGDTNDTITITASNISIGFTTSLNSYAFFGLTSGTPFSSVVFTDTGGGPTSTLHAGFYPAIDNLSYQLAATASDPIPEPATLLLLGTGLAGVVRTRRRRNR
jgi:hypothetical protein